MIYEILLGAGYILAIASVVLIQAQKNKAALITLLLAGFAIFTSATGWYPFLTVWDERFHALVTKNMLGHPLMPTLYGEYALPHEFTNF